MSTPEFSYPQLNPYPNQGAPSLNPSAPPYFDPRTTKQHFTGPEGNIGASLPTLPGTETKMAQAMQNLRITLDGVRDKRMDRSCLLKNVQEIELAYHSVNKKYIIEAGRLRWDTREASSKPAPRRSCLELLAKAVGAVALAMISPSLFILGAIAYVAHYAFSEKNPKDDIQDIKKLKIQVDEFMLDNLQALYNITLLSQ